MYQQEKVSIVFNKIYDNKNQNALPKNFVAPKIKFIKSDKYVKKAKIYVETNFPNNYGSLDNFIYHIDSKQTIKWLMEFLKKRINDFGEFHDAISINNFNYHSVLSLKHIIKNFTNRII